MKTLLALLLSASPAFACGDRPSGPPSGALTDAARGKRIEAALRDAQSAREKRSEELSKAAEATAEIQELKRRLDGLSWGAPEREELSRTLRALRKREVWDVLDRELPVTVHHSTFLCGGTRLACGHSINAGSSWSVSNARLGKDAEVSVKGEAMHYLAEHGQASAWLFDRLETLLGLPKVQGEKIGEAVTKLVAAPWR